MPSNLQVIPPSLRPQPLGSSTRVHWLPLTTVAVLLFVGLPTAAAMHYPGDAGPFLLFEVSFTLMLLLAAPRPRSYVYTFLAAFLFLGFWAKFNLHTLLDYPYQEPVGSFDGKGASWDAACRTASFGAIGVSVARVVQVTWHLRRHELAPAFARGLGEPDVPVWFTAHRRAVWISTVFVILSLNLANLVLAFYEVGVNPRMVLPAHGNVMVAWLLKLGSALWVAVLVHWELRIARSRPDRVFLAPVGEAVVTGVSALSRGVFLFHVLPYWLVVLARRRHFLKLLGRRRLAVLAVLAVAGFILSLGAVSALRLLLYPGPASAQVEHSASKPQRKSKATRTPTGTTRPRAIEAPSSSRRAVTPDERFDSQRLFFVFREVRSLFVERWNGLEGVMAVSAHDELGHELLLEAARENPGRAQNSLYQKLSGADRVYDRRSGYTFLTLPGVMGILAYSGSVIVVLIGMALLTSLTLGVEGLARRLVANPFVASVSGLAMASELSQANFPYLLLTFFVLLTLTLLVLRLVVAWPRTVVARISAARGT